MNLPSTSQLTLWFLLSCTAKATLLLGLAASAAYLLRHHSATRRHYVWALGMASSMALPLLMLLLPSWHSATLGNLARFLGTGHAAMKNTTFQGLPSMVIDAATASPLSGQMLNLILLLWGLGTLFVVVSLLGGLARLAWISAQATPVAGEDWVQTVVRICGQLGVARRVRVLECADAASMPLTWGIVRPRILLPAGATEWSEELREVVLSHELAHIARHNWLVQICAELSRGLYWFHPLAWFAAASLRRESERACDDSVLNSGVEASRYAKQLLDLARTLKNAHRGWSAALAIARPSNLERRFIAMLDPNLSRCGISRRAGLFAKVAALCLLLPLAALRLPGQDLAGKLTGTILDISDAAVPNATIIMTNPKANSIDMTTSNAEGNFVFKALPAGDYEMKVLKPGFAVYRAPQIVLESGRDLALTAKLEMGSLSDSVEVSAEGSGKTAPSAEAPAEAKPKRIRVGGNVEAAKVLTKVQPTYPESARAAGVQGTVVLHAVVGMDGTLLSLQVLNSQIHPDLARAAVEAVSQWRYQTTLLNGQPVEVDTVITVNFKLLP
ncbi:MAG TPA: M56 family metallopeptidase [Candidatus Sulfotelmatobacter sp.]|nr:M56 family metallopeptidase [Candidatus Sulfotelmatobacter sp.]